MAVTRREALSRLAVAGAGTVLAPSIIRGQASPIIVGGRPVEIVVRPLGAFTVRISVRPIVNGKPQPVINRGTIVAINGVAGQQNVPLSDPRQGIRPVFAVAQR